MDAQDQGQKRKRTNKNKKKNWKKAPIDDVEEYLEDKRLQERTGGLVSEKTDEQLYFIDKEVEKTDGEPVVKKRKKRVPKPLKCHSNLLQISPRLPVISKKKIKAQEAKAARGETARERQAKEDKLKAEEARKTRREERINFKEAAFDLWGDTDVTPVATSKIKDEHYLRVTKKLPVKVPGHYRSRPSGVSAVEVAHPGASYNPEFFEHQDLLQKANEVEEKKLKEEMRIKRATDDMFPSKGEAPTEADYIKEMSAGLEANSEEEDDDEEEDTHGDPDRISVNPPVRREDMKTQKQRRKAKEQKELAKKLKQEKEAKRRQNDFYRLRTLKKEIETREQELKERAEKKTEKQEKYKDKPHRLGKRRYEDADLEIKLTDELEGNLRLLKPEGNLLEDRFKSLQKRNVLEPRKRAKIVKKFKPKWVEKRGHRNVTA